MENKGVSTKRILQLTVILVLLLVGIQLSLTKEKEVENEKESVEKTELLAEDETHNAKKQYSAKTIYINGSAMSLRSESSYTKLQEVIDNGSNSWVSFGEFNANDDKGTWIGARNTLGGDILYNTKVNDDIVVTDSSGNPHTYRVSHIYYNNTADVFDDELIGALPKEYIVLQTSELHENEQSNGNRQVIADKIDE